MEGGEVLKGTHRFLADAVGWVVVSLPRREDQGRTQVRGTVGVGRGRDHELNFGCMRDT